VKACRLNFFCPNVCFLFSRVLFSFLLLLIPIFSHLPSLPHRATVLMHIHSITISGFKSYRDPATLTLQPTATLVCGLNGSGKSNLFSALEFVLSDRYSSLSQDERRALLHDGGGRTTLAASVTVVFDNSDGRLPVDRPQVSLARTVGLKSDEYRIDGRIVALKDVQALLETAGFSRANPYYLVRQGEIEKLVAATDVERLEVVREVAGTRVYDERRGEALRLLGETDEKRKKIEAQMAEMDVRLKQLDAEKGALGQYTAVESRRRAAEYVLSERKLSEARHAIEEADTLRDSALRQVAACSDADAAARTARKTAERNLDAARQALANITARLDSVTDARRRAVERQARLENMLRQERSQESLDSAAEEARLLANQQVVSRRQELIERRTIVESQLQSVIDSEAQKSQELDRLEIARMKDPALWGAELKRRDALITSLEQRVVSVQKQADGMDAKCLEGKQRCQKLRDTIVAHRATVQKLTDASAQLEEVRLEAAKHVRDAQRQRDSVLQLFRDASSAMEEAEHRMHRAVPHDIVAGLSSLRSVLEGSSSGSLSRGVHGTLVELLSCRVDAVEVALEACLGNTLMHVVVDSDATAGLIVKKINAASLPGRISLLPISSVVADQTSRGQRARDRIESTAKAIADEYGNEVVPMSSMINCSLADRTAAVAIVQMFLGRVFLARSLDVAAAVSSKYGVDCVTLQGDVVAKRGSIRGGYVDRNRSRIEAQRALKIATAKKEESDKARKEVERRVDDCTQRLAVVSGEMDRSRREHASALEALNDAEAQLRMSEDEVKVHTEAVQHLQAQIAQMQRVLGHEKDARQLLVDKSNVRLSQEEASAMSVSVETIVAVEKSVAMLRNKRESLSAELTSIDSALASISHPQVTAIAASTSSRASAHRSAVIAECTARLSSLGAEIESFDAEVSALEKDRASTSANLRSSTDELDACRAAEEEATQSLADTHKLLMEADSKRSSSLKLRDEAVQALKQIGAVPATVGEMSGLSQESLLKIVDEAHAKLSKMAGNINRAAMGQFEEAHKRRVEFGTRLEETSKAHKAIEELVAHLDRKKDETLYSTFSQIAREFERVYSELVPSSQGRASLRFYEGGVAIDTPKGTSRLSGGEKSLLALTLIFAIQRCDPAPFYIFDEIDANLDANHAVAVARMVQRLSRVRMIPDVEGAADVESDRQEAEGTTQFLVTSFKAQSVPFYDECFRVGFVDRVSIIEQCGRDEAVQVMERQER
jgi:structural maintenance of chromosome 3 (chondroitin sulfate proteoglycan 6)